MKKHVFATLLVLCLSAAVAMAQTNATAQSNTTGNTSSATAASGQAAQPSGTTSSSQSQATMPAQSQSTMDNSSQAMSSSDADVQSKIKDALKNNPILSNVNVDAMKINVTQDKVELTGNVNNNNEKKAIDKEVQQFAGSRTIVDHLTTTGSGYKGNLSNGPTSATPGGSPIPGGKQNPNDMEKKVPK